MFGEQLLPVEFDLQKCIDVTHTPSEVHNLLQPGHVNGPDVGVSA